MDQAHRLRELERENARLKKLVVEQALDVSILQEAASGTDQPSPTTAGGGAGSSRAGLIGEAGLPGPGSAAIDPSPPPFNYGSGAEADLADDRNGV